MTKIQDLKLDFYSEYVKYYEESIRFYAHPAEVDFKLNATFNGNGYTIKELIQGENGVYFFEMWRGHSEGLFSELHGLLIKESLKNFPRFFLSWVKCEGWNFEELSEEISKKDIIWLKNSLEIIIENLSTDDMDKDCFINLNIFLDFVIKNNWSLHISEN